MNIIFFGTPEFAKIILEKLIVVNYKPILVVTAPDAPVGRKQEMTPPAVKVLAEQHKIRVTQPEKLSSLEVGPADLMIVAAYGKLIPKEILDLPKYGALNVHPSLLPKYRGSSPIQYAILNGDEETGVTIIKMDEEIDHGPIIASIKYSLRSPAGRQVSSIKYTTEDLMLKLAEIGAELLIRAIPKWIAGEVTPIEQVDEDATYTKIIIKEDGHINWNKNAEEIERQIRAFTPWPGSFTFWKDKKIEIFSGSTVELSAPKEMVPGQTFLYDAEKLAVKTSSGVFVIEELQLEGKNKVTIKEFLNGYAEIIGTTLT